jgi:hypothetical protein
MATSKGKVGLIVGISVLLVGVASFFIYKGIKSSKDAQKRLEEEANKNKGGQDTKSIITSDGNVSATTTTTETTPQVQQQTTPPPSGLVIQPKSQSILRQSTSTLSKKLVTFSSGVQIQVEGISNVGGYTWYKITDPKSGLVGFIRADVVNVVK